MCEKDTKSNAEHDPFTEWVKANLKGRTCIRFTCVEGDSSSNDDQKCQCGKKRSDHEHSYLRNPIPDSKWQVETHTKLIPVDAFGEVNFRSKKPYKTQFVRADIFSNLETLWSLLTEQWKLPPPKLIISVTGGTPDFVWSAHQGRVFQRGLRKAAQSTDAWIITSGRKFGLMNVVGQAVQENAENDSYVTAIGLTTWGWIKRAKQNALRQKKPYGSRRKHDIDPSNSHLIMFDDGTTGRVGIENLVWGELVQKICATKLHGGEKSSEEGVTIPSVCLTANGTTTSLATVYDNIKHGTPCLIIEDTGTMADILAYAVKHARQDGKNCRKYLSNTTLSHISRMLLKEYGAQDLEVSLDRIKQCVRDPRLIATYRIDDVSESTEGLLHAIVKLIVGTSNQLSNQLNLAITWNTVDVARTTIFAESCDWSEKDLRDAFKYAIKSSAIDFVDLFIDKGVVLEKDQLTELYNEAEDHTLPQKLLKMKKKKRTLTLDEVNRFIETRKLVNKEEQNTTESICCSWQDLFLYSVITDRKELAKEFWKHLDEPIMDALAACKILQKIDSDENDIRKKHTMKQHANEHEERAIGTLNECFAKHECETLQILEKRAPRWGNRTCMEMAKSVKSLRFLAHAAPQLVLNNVWKGKRSEDYLKLLSKDEESGHTKREKITEKVKMFFSAPQTKFLFNFIMHIAFLCLFSYIILRNFIQDHIRVEEFVLIGWVATMIFEEFYQVFHNENKGFKNKVKSYFTSDYWNIVDVVAVSMFLSGTVLRKFSMTFDIARIILALDFLAFYLRFLQTLYVSTNLGPKLIMIKKMMWDLFFFMFLLFIFLTGYGVTYFAVMYPNEPRGDTILKGIFSTTYLQMFSYKLMDQIEDDDCSNNATVIELGLAERCPEYTFIGRILLYAYMMLSTILLLNLLIAMLSYTFSRVQEKNEELWKYHWYKINIEYTRRATLPPPFNILSHLWNFCVLCWTLFKGILGRKCHVFDNNQGNSLDGGSKTMEININQRFYARNYLLKQKMKVNDTVEVEIDGIFKTFDFRRSCVERKLNQMEERVKILTSIVRENNLQSHLAEKDLEDTDGGDNYIAKEIHSGVHYHSRTSPYPGTVKRGFPVPSKKVDWKNNFVEYDPVAFTDDSILNDDLSDEVDPVPLQIGRDGLPTMKFNTYDETCKCNRESFHGPYQLDENGLPRNPRGRTGFVGRGTLRRFGPNHRIDFVITRWEESDNGDDMESDKKRVLEFLAVKKTRNNLAWAIPSTMILEEDGLSKKITNDLLFELDFTNDEKETFRKALQEFLSKNKRKEIYKGYVDETRNTDNAWVEVEARNYHDADKSLFVELEAQLKERLYKVPRLKWEKVERRTHMLYTSHEDLLRKTAMKHKAYF